MNSVAVSDWVPVKRRRQRCAIELTPDEEMCVCALEDCLMHLNLAGQCQAKRELLRILYEVELRTNSDDVEKSAAVCCSDLESDSAHWK